MWGKLMKTAVFFETVLKPLVVKVAQLLPHSCPVATLASSVACVSTSVCLRKWESLTGGTVAEGGLRTLVEHHLCVAMPPRKQVDHHRW